MNLMNMPGFNAEASFHKRDRSYPKGPSIAPASGNEVVPATMCEFICASGAAVCGAFCGPGTTLRALACRAACAAGAVACNKTCPSLWGLLTDPLKVTQ
jgi:hypothetical protein